MSLLELLCHVDDFWQVFAALWETELLESGLKQRRRAGHLCPREVMTIVIHFHQIRYPDFKTDYTQYVEIHLKAEFPQLVSYNRFVQLLPSVLVPHGVVGAEKGVSLIVALGEIGVLGINFDRIPSFDKLFQTLPQALSPLLKLLNLQ